MFEDLLLGKINKINLKKIKNFFSQNLIQKVKVSAVQGKEDSN
jgi:hypothetical protein